MKADHCLHQKIAVFVAADDVVVVVGAVVDADVVVLVVALASRENKRAGHFLCRRIREDQQKLTIPLKIPTPSLSEVG